MSLESHDYDDVEPTRPPLTTDQVKTWVERLAAQSRDQHGCPDFMPRATEIAQAVFDIAKGHPALGEELRNRLDPPELKQFQADRRVLLDRMIPESVFTSSFLRMKRGYLINSWAATLGLNAMGCSIMGGD